MYVKNITVLSEKIIRKQTYKNNITIFFFLNHLQET